jgi:hypothetical protein
LYVHPTTLKSSQPAGQIYHSGVVHLLYVNANDMTGNLMKDSLLKTEREECINGKHTTAHDFFLKPIAVPWLRQLLASF